MNRFKTNIFSTLFFLLAANLAFGQTKHQCDFTCSPHPFALRFHAAPLLTKLKSNTYNSEAKSKIGFNIGTDLIYYFVNTNKFKSSISVGLGLTKYNSEYNLTYADSAWDADADNQQVFITEKLNELKENQSVLYLDIPVKLGFEYAFSQRMDGYLNLGVTYGLAINNQYNNSGLLTRTGFYPDYNALFYDIDVPGSSYFYPSNKSISGNGAFNKQNNISFEAALGIKFKLNPKWSVFGGLKIMHGFQNINLNEGMMVQSTTSDFQLNSVLNRNDELYTRAIGAEFGLALNLGKCKKAKENEIVEPLVKNVEVKYSVTNSETNKPVKATIEVKENGQTVQTVNCDENGEAKTNLQAGKVYTIDYTASNYVAQNDTLDLSKADAGIQKDIKLSPVIVNTPAIDSTEVIIPQQKQDSVMLIAVDKKSGKPVKATIEVKQNNQIIQTAGADDNGHAYLNVPENKAYIIIASADGYVYQYQTVDLDAVNKSSKKEFKLEPMVKIKKGKNLEINPINFKSGLEGINPSDIETLNLVLKMLKDNPRMQIEVSGHADSQGDKVANMELSLKRSQTIIDHLVSKGANSEQLIPLGCGSSRPIGDNATVEGRSKNRRVEFKVLKN